MTDNSRAVLRSKYTKLPMKFDWKGDCKGDSPSRTNNGFKICHHLAETNCQPVQSIKMLQGLPALQRPACIQLPQGHRLRAWKPLQSQTCVRQPVRQRRSRCAVQAAAAGLPSDDPIQVQTGTTRSRLTAPRLSLLNVCTLGAQVASKSRLSSNSTPVQQAQAGEQGQRSSFNQDRECSLCPDDAWPVSKAEGWP